MKSAYLDPADLTFRQRIPALILISMTQFMIPFDYMSITVASVVIREDLGFSDAAGPWILSSYILAFGGLLLLGGKLGDLYGRRRLLIIGLVTFCFFSVVTAFTSDPILFMAARVLKGVGAAILSPAMLSILNTLFPESKDRHRALGIYWFCAVSGGAAGVWLGGALTDISWRLTLFFNVPLGLTLAFIAFRILPESRLLHASRKLDFGGAVLSILAFGSLIFAVTRTLTFSSLPLTVGLFLLSVTSFYAFYRLQKVHESPLVPPQFFTLKNIIGANIFCFFWAAANTNYPVAVMFQQVFHYTPGQTGLAMVPMSFIGLLSIYMVVKTLDRYGPVRAMLLGAFTEGVGIAILCTVTPESTYAYMFPGMALTSVGFALAGIAVKIPAVYDVQEKDQGVASGLVFATQQLGNAFAIPVYTAVLARASQYGSGTPEQVLAYGFHWTFGAGVAFLVIAIAAVLILVREPEDMKKKRAIKNDHRLAVDEA